MKAIKQLALILGLSLIGMNTRAADSPAATEKPAATADSSGLKSQKEKVSYSIGLNIGKSMKQQNVDVDIDAVAKGLKSGLSGDKALLTDEEIEKVMADFQKDMRAESEKKGAENKKKADSFLTENAKKEGVKTTASGLQYKVMKEGTGPMPKEGDTVETHYRGTLVDGTEFDSSYKRNEPATFPLDGVIKGWTEALKMMKVGSKWQLFIPPDLAYGERGAGPIPPNSPLIFEIELLAIK